MKRSFLFGFFAALLLAGCVAAPTAIEKKDAGTSVVKLTEETPSAFPHLFEERDLLLDGIALLNPQGKPETQPEPATARSVFISLIQRYPGGKWRPAAEAFVRLIDERNALQEVGAQDRLRIERTEEEKSKALQENDHLKKTVRELTDKLQSETSALAQENEQLKKDIEKLKALEVELERRDRTLR
jgi:hypothetical protein